MWAIPLLLDSLALFLTTVVDKRDVQQWTEVVRRATDRYVKRNIWQPQSMDTDPELQRIPAEASYHWVHKNKNDGRVYWCGGAGGLSTIQWIIGYMSQSHEIKAFNAGRVIGDEIAVWNIVTDKDTRNCTIEGEFNKGKLTGYIVNYDYKSPRV